MGGKRITKFPENPGNFCLCVFPSARSLCASKILEKEQALWHGHPTQTSMTKLLSGNLRADLSFPTFRPDVLASGRQQRVLASRCCACSWQHIQLVTPAFVCSWLAAVTTEYPQSERRERNLKSGKTDPVQFKGVLKQRPSCSQKWAFCKQSSPLWSRTFTSLVLISFSSIRWAKTRV